MPRFFFLLRTNAINKSSKALIPTLPNPIFSIFSSQLSTSFLVTKTPKKLRKKRKKKDSPRTKLVQTQPNLIPHLERIVERDALFRFINKTKQFLSAQPEHVLRLDDAGKLHRELGFPRGRNVTRFILRHPLLLQTYRHTDGKMWLGFTDLMEDLLLEEQAIMDSMEQDRVAKMKPDPSDDV